MTSLTIISYVGGQPKANTVEFA